MIRKNKNLITGRNEIHLALGYYDVTICVARFNVYHEKHFVRCISTISSCIPKWIAHRKLKNYVCCVYLAQTYKWQKKRQDGKRVPTPIMQKTVSTFVYIVMQTVARDTIKDFEEERTKVEFVPARITFLHAVFREWKMQLENFEPNATWLHDNAIPRAYLVANENPWYCGLVQNN